jgi:hypothetical protein
MPARNFEPQQEEFPVAPEEVFVSPFEAALQQANKEGSERRRDRKQKKGRVWEEEYDEEEDLIQRTIAHHKKSKGG